MIDDLSKLVPLLLTGGGIGGIITAVIAWRKDSRDGRAAEVDLLERIRAIAAEEVKAARDEVADLRGRVEALELRARRDGHWIQALLEHVDFLRALILRRWPDAILPPVPTEPAE